MRLAVGSQGKSPFGPNSPLERGVSSAHWSYLLYLNHCCFLHTLSLRAELHAGGVEESLLEPVLGSSRPSLGRLRGGGALIGAKWAPMAEASWRSWPPEAPRGDHDRDKVGEVVPVLERERCVDVEVGFGGEHRRRDPDLGGGSRRCRASPVGRTASSGRRWQGEGNQGQPRRAACRVRLTWKPREGELVPLGSPKPSFKTR